MALGSAVALALVTLVAASAGCMGARLERLERELHSPSGDVSLHAARRLGEDMGERAIPVLLKATYSDQVHVRMHATERLSLPAYFDAPRPEVIARIGQLLRDPEPWVRTAAIHAATVYHGCWPLLPQARQEKNGREIRPVIPGVLALLADEDAQVRSVVASYLPTFCRPLPKADVRRLLRPHLKSADLNVRARVARSAGLAGEPAAANVLLECLEDAYTKESTLLGEIAMYVYVCDKEPPGVLVGALNARPATRRAAATRALGALGSFRSALAHPLQRLRTPILNALRKRGAVENDTTLQKEIDRAIKAIEAAIKADQTHPLRAAGRPGPDVPTS